MRFAQLRVICLPSKFYCQNSSNEVGDGGTQAHRVEAADAVQAGGGQDDLVEHGDRAADQARVAALGDHCQPPFVAVRQHLQEGLLGLKLGLWVGLRLGLGLKFG